MKPNSSGVPRVPLLHHEVLGLRGREEWDYRSWGMLLIGSLCLQHRHHKDTHATLEIRE